MNVEMRTWIRLVVDKIPLPDTDPGSDICLRRLTYPRTDKTDRNGGLINKCGWINADSNVAASEVDAKQTMPRSDVATSAGRVYKAPTRVHWRFTDLSNEANEGDGPGSRCITVDVSGVMHLEWCTRSVVLKEIFQNLAILTKFFSFQIIELI